MPPSEPLQPGPGPADEPGAGVSPPSASQRVWTEAFRAFDALYEMDPAARAAELERLRSADAAVAEAVQGLLAEHDAQRLADPDGDPAAADPPATDPGHDPQATRPRADLGQARVHAALRTLPRGGSAEPQAAPAPETIGPWRLLRELGRGGTARVWLARREDVPWLREVALKVPLMGVYRDDLRERLIRERDILSRLVHPHIARLYDAGFAESQPWLAIEYVQGQDILAWCDARTLGLRERVALFRQVLQAVQYAHAALIVHRDLKPENILVTADGSVRLLDFGIAKLMAEGASHTETTQLTHLAGRMLTPAYASPEQLRDEPLTTATDIYSLGVVLYQLLTGVHPAVGAGARSIQQVERAVTEGRLALASRSGLKPEAAQARGLAVKALKRSLSGDLEAILAKALNLEAAQRYETAAAFDAELEAWLDGRPVRARKPGWLQLTAKLVRRHPWVSGFAVASVLALSTTAVIAVLQAREARVQAEQARVEAARAKASQEFLLGLFDEADPDRNGGKDVLARDLLGRGEARVERDLADQPIIRAELLGSIGRIWWQFGDMDSAARVLGKRTEVIRRHGDAAAVLDAVLDEAQGAREAGDDRRVAAILEQADSVAAKMTLSPTARARLSLEKGWMTARKRNQMPLALSHLEEALALYQQAGRHTEQAEALVAIGWVLRTQRRYQEADEHLKRAEDLLVGLRQRQVTRVSQAQINAVKLERLRTMNGAGAYRRGWTLIDKLMSDVVNDAGENRYYVLQFRSWWFAWMIQLGLYEQASTWSMTHVDEFAKLDIREAAVSAERHRWLARMWIGLGQWSRAQESIDAGLAVGGVHGTIGEVNLHGLMVALRVRQGRSDEAMTALGAFEAAAERLPNDVVLQAELLQMRAAVLSLSKRHDEALEQAERAARALDAAFGPTSVRAARAELNRLLVWWRNPMRRSDVLDPAESIEAVRKVMEDSYLDVSEPLRLARGLDSRIARSSGRSRPPELPALAAMVDDPRMFAF